MLTTGDTAIARELAEELDRCNTQRQEVEQAIVAEAHEMIRAQGGLGERGAIVLDATAPQPGGRPQGTFEHLAAASGFLRGQQIYPCGRFVALIGQLLRALI